MKAYAKTDIGAKRQTNQDYIFCSMQPVGSLPNLFIVADGMGGHKAGDLASRYTVEKFLDSVKGSEAENPISIIEEAVRYANLALMDKAKESIDYEGMGTTLVVATFIDKSLYIANVGDSRLYIVNNEIQQITRDHSLVEEMINLGEIDRRNARTHEKKNIITRAIGVDSEVVADFFEVEYSKGDIILMCSDGLSNMIEDEDMKMIINEGNDVSEIANKLIEVANNNGGKDNISVVLVEPD
ncbi:MAG: Stp1/IreP family PP2C-type Ser/Thr phosphatase [Clostridiales bacterium]|uniref:Stp1/IreP family PP2C-type Ser/Thr phosphatase n=1 Tax=Bovifimicola ammoniilytica TaxID=2981720 RepID=UPI00033CAD9F|nr:Stp1/IreP family PP2C-type Ser/Thr phosphatase [Bovifimicola ammoniilytica]MBD8942947.1 Stp1/IreP family PP2C-type Ser/Thr phosphatase [Clostridiales bacterium]MCU6754004.1 Stp1/IreP family PP2C-type Ser/Thr phosphatase [Bovifimicola ammoniilytica]CCZ04623.1 protein phosphatase 2C [Eubacterium sp. CAG:603]SCJ77825.1 Serine/threonine phosphatase stp [uncultured Eubacterium sp.]